MTNDDIKNMRSIIFSFREEMILIDDALNRIEKKLETTEQWLNYNEEEINDE